MGSGGPSPPFPVFFSQHSSTFVWPAAPVVATILHHMFITLAETLSMNHVASFTSTQNALSPKLSYLRLLFYGVIPKTLAVWLLITCLGDATPSAAQTHIYTTQSHEGSVELINVTVQPWHNPACSFSSIDAVWSQSISTSPRPVSVSEVRDSSQRKTIFFFPAVKLKALNWARR